MHATISPVDLATHVRQRFPNRERGALLVHCTADGDPILAVFGNDGYRFDKRVCGEVELARQWLTAAGARELGFGISPDGQSWVMLLQVENRRYRTAAGQAFYAEMVVAEVEEEVWRAWLEVCGARCRPAPLHWPRATRQAG
jgi:hypothetical protein